jgi:hypothetical protein
MVRRATRGSGRSCRPLAPRVELADSSREHVGRHPVPSARWTPRRAEGQPRGPRPGMVGGVDRAAEAWIRAHVNPAGAIETAHQRPWATVLRVPLADGVAWFKACRPVQAFEPWLAALPLYAELQRGEAAHAATIWPAASPTCGWRRCRRAIRSSCGTTCRSRTTSSAGCLGSRRGLRAVRRAGRPPGPGDGAARRPPHGQPLRPG